MKDIHIYLLLHWRQYRIKLFERTLNVSLGGSERSPFGFLGQSFNFIFSALRYFLRPTNEFSYLFDFKYRYFRSI
ncbi:MAG: hypothetical protein UW07_C0038G0001 [Candidatus Nomurabacteria bacterium GW2011_GWF2_43_8]|uniref:Uncharacterized protein n=3 Tax=Candidatus Nomuraibacteriota TaxID=1752729 RepID=A0A0G1FK28_9BACT|nr:MAG: hypothetical protein UV76_C0014G0025 [Candidatus Nomurabacteria bacterium GW2011_GWA2_43_15]KKT19592.1 MAG: hypothetical protein UW02_C0007G0001 [Candidatus Nomurabacteria bacterium GW2011_GWB1_43_7]KKT22348.1 MAG: hypothetical protein UW07_C0038G0001 [Candidatus Nomurabacteria bacterium GW2011_GWF2_43_8]